MALREELSRRRASIVLLTAGLPRKALFALAQTVDQLAQLPSEMRSSFSWESLSALVLAHQQAAQPILLEELFERYLHSLSKKPRSAFVVTVRSAERCLCDYFGASRDVKSLTSREVAIWADQLRTKLHPVTVEAYLRIATTAWHHGVGPLPENPFRTVRH